MSGCGSWWKMLTVGVVVMVGLTSLGEAQTASTSCAQELVPCVDYINSTNPPNSCCTPLKQTVATQLSCLCNLYTTPGLLESFGINVTEALNLSRRCGVSTSLSNCNVTAPSPSSVTPPATPGGDNGAGRVAFTGLSFLLLFWASMLFD